MVSAKQRAVAWAAALALVVVCSQSHGGGAVVVMRQQTTTGGGGGSAVWCAARSDASSTDLQNALDWACGQGSDQGQVDCGPISQGGQCFSPDTVASHASYAFNAYFQRMNQAPDACNFNNCAQTTTSDPSTGSCTYPSSSSSLGLLTTTNATSPTNFGGSASGATPNFKSWPSHSSALLPFTFLALWTLPRLM